MINAARLAALLSLCALAPMAHAMPPSGQALELVETLAETQPGTGELWLVVRVLAPAIGQNGFDPDDAQVDLDWICGTWGLEAAANQAEQPAMVVVQMMDRIVPRGQAAPEATQFFAGYTLENGDCIWEVF